MAKIDRKTAKIFGQNASANQIGIFGSLAAASPAYSTDPETIQSLSEWLSGWFDAVIGANSPAIEDMNAYCYVMAYQIAYILQNGIGEWDAETPYYIGSLATSGTKIYRSIADNNTNNAVTDSTKWVIQNAQPSSADVSITIPSAYSWQTSFPTIPNGVTYTIAGSAVFSGTTTIAASGTLNVTGTVYFN